MMTTKNNPYKRLGRLFHHARHHQNLSLFNVSQSTGIAVPKLISIEEAHMKFYEANTMVAVELIQRYAQFLQVDAHDLIREISQVTNIRHDPVPIPAFLLKK